MGRTSIRRFIGKNTSQFRSTTHDWGTGPESLEPRLLLAGDLVANWTADDLNSTLNDGSTVTAWVDSVAGIVATGVGTPRLAQGVLSGRSTIRFDGSDGADALIVDDNASPVSNAGDFSVSLVFVTDSNALVGGNDNWYSNTGQCVFRRSSNCYTKYWQW